MYVTYFVKFVYLNLSFLAVVGVKLELEMWSDVGIYRVLPPGKKRTCAETDMLCVRLGARVRVMPPDARIQPETMTRLEPLFHPCSIGSRSNRLVIRSMELVLHTGTPENDFSAPRSAGQASHYLILQP